MDLRAVSREGGREDGEVFEEDRLDFAVLLPVHLPHVRQSHVRQSHVRPSHVRKSYVRQSCAVSRQGDGEVFEEDRLDFAILLPVHLSHVRQSHARQSDVRQSHVRKSHARQSHLRQSYVRQSHVRQSRVRKSQDREVLEEDRLHFAILLPVHLQREFFIDNLLDRIHFIIVMIRWTGLAPWNFKLPFPGSFTSTFLTRLTRV